MIDILGALIHIVVLSIIGGIFVWLAAKALQAPKATYWHAILTVASAVILTDIIGYFLGGLGWVTTIIELIVILLLIKHFFGVGWIKAAVIAILAIVILIVVVFVLALLGIAFAAAALKGLFPSVPSV